MSEEMKCYIHNTSTRLTCSECGRPICPKCAIDAPIGYKCKECTKPKVTHLESLTKSQIIYLIFVGIITASVMGFLWNFLKIYGIFINILVAYLVGFCNSRAISKVIGNKIGLKFEIFAGLITFAGMVYNPILLFLAIQQGMDMPTMVALSTLGFFTNIYSVIAVTIAIWASVRHFKF